MGLINSKGVEVGQDFFQYTVEVMRSQNVVKAFDRLQRSRLNSNLVCFLIWYAHRAYGRIKRKQFSKLTQVVFAWNEEVVEELSRLQSMIALHQNEKMSTIRSWLHDEVDIAHQMERCLLLEAVPVLQELRKTPQQAIADACYNLANYSKCAKIILSDVGFNDCVVILSETLKDFTGPMIIRELNGSLQKARVHWGDASVSQLSL